MSYRPKIKNNASGALTDLALDAETINGITSADIVTKTLLNSGLTTGGNIIFNDRLIVNATSDLIGDLYIGQWNHSGGSVTPGSNQASLRVNGTLTTTGEINTNGHSISVGNISCGEINGSTAYLGNTWLSSLSVSGTTSLSGNITCNGTFNGSDASYSGSVTVSGTLRANNDLKTQSVYPSTTNSKSLGKSNYLYKHSYITEMHTDKITSLTNTETYIDPSTGEPATRNVFVTMPLSSGIILTEETAASTYQPLDADLTAIAGLSGTSGFLKKTAANTWTLDTTSYATSDHTHTAFNNKLAVNPGSTGGSYDEGVRINKASNGWANVILGGNSGTTSGTASGLWLVGRRGQNGGTSGAVGDFTIEHNGSTGKGLTLYANGNKPRWNNNELAYSSDIPATNVIPATMTANKVLLSTATSGTSKWSDFTTAGFLKTDASGVISIDSNTYLTTSGTAADSRRLGGFLPSYYAKASNIPTKVSDLTNDSGFITGVAWDDVTDKPTFATVATSGSYNDLTNKPTIPSEVTESTVSGWGFTKNAGTVTSVRVQAGTGLSSSTSTAQTSTLNTTISIASGYKLPTTTEWSGKQNTLSSTNKLSSSYISWDGDIDLSNDPEGHHITNVGGYESSNGNFSIDNDGWMYYTNGNPINIQETHGSKTITLLTDYEEVRTKNTSYIFKEDGLYLDSTKVTFALGTTATTAAAGDHAHGNITNTGTITSTAVTSATGVLVYDSSNKIQRATAANARSIIGAAPTSHASTATTYGVGTSSSYGHVKVISGDLNGKSATNGYAASQSHTHSQYQATLVSGTNIKTINNQSLLGSGNINISGGSSNYTHHCVFWFGNLPSQSITNFMLRMHIWTTERSTNYTNTDANKETILIDLEEGDTYRDAPFGYVTTNNVTGRIIDYETGNYDDDSNTYYYLIVYYVRGGSIYSMRLDSGVNEIYTKTTMYSSVID